MPNAGPTETRLADEAVRPGGTAPKLPPSAAARPDGTVRGVPRRWLRLEGAVLLAASLIAYPANCETWWLVPLALLVPNLFMAGYLRGTRPGAQLHNIAHSTVLPAGMVGLGWWQSQPFVLALGLIWLAHVGTDRLLGHGLKYDDHFQHTHLGIQVVQAPSGRAVIPARWALRILLPILAHPMPTGVPSPGQRDKS